MEPNVDAMIKPIGNSSVTETHNPPSGNRTGEAVIESSSHYSTFEMHANSPSSSTTARKEDLDVSKCMFTFDFISSNCKIQDDGLVLPKPYPSEQFKKCLTFYLQEGYGLPFKLHQRFFYYITTGIGFADYCNGKSDWNMVPNIPDNVTRMSIWKPILYPMLVQFKNQSPSVSAELRDFLLSLDSLDLAQLQSLLFFSSHSGNMEKNGHIMVTIVLDGNRQNCAIGLGSLVIPQFKDKRLLKKQVIALLKNDNPINIKNVSNNVSRKDKNKNLDKSKEINDNESSKIANPADAFDVKPQPQKIDAALLPSNQTTSSCTTTTTSTSTTLATQATPEANLRFVNKPKFKYIEKQKDNESTNEKNGNIQAQKGTKTVVVSSSKQSPSTQTTSTNFSTTTSSTTLTQTTPKTGVFIKDAKSTQNPKYTAPKQAIEKDEKTPQKKVKLEGVPSSNQSSFAHTTTTTTTALPAHSSTTSTSTTTLTTLTQTTMGTTSQTTVSASIYIQTPVTIHMTTNLVSMYTNFEVLVKQIYPRDFEACFNYLKHMLLNYQVEYIAFDCEMTGLYTVNDDERHSRDYNTLFTNNTKQLKDGTKTNSVFHLGLVIKIRQGGWIIWSFHTAPELTKESFTPSTFKFLFEAPLSERYPQASSEAIASMISTKLKTISSTSISQRQFASLAGLLLNSYVPFIVFSGYADLLYLFKAIGTSVDELDHYAIQAQLPNRIFDIKSVCMSASISIVRKPSLSTYFHAFYSNLKENSVSLHNASFDAVLTAMLFEALKVRYPIELRTKNGLFNYEYNN